jgi:hypothetical protein
MRADIHDGPEHNSSNLRPDTLMQDRTADRSTKASCNARPHHTFGSWAALQTGVGGVALAVEVPEAERVAEDHLPTGLDLVRRRAP